MNRKETLQDIKQKEKENLVDHFLVTPCVRCGDDSHRCLDCPNTSSGLKTGYYGALNAGKKLGANKFIDSLKVKYKENPNDRIFLGAIKKREKQDGQGDKGAAEPPQEHQQHNTSDGLTVATADQSDSVEASNTQDPDAVSQFADPYSFDYDLNEVRPQVPPNAAQLPANFSSVSRQGFTKDLKKLKGLKLQYPARTEFATYDKCQTVLTNHFQVQFKAGKDVVLYAFRVQELASKSKRQARAMMKSIIENFDVLRDNQASFATDYFTTIVSWVDLRPLMKQAQKINLSAAGQLEQYQLLTFEDGPTTLQYERSVNMKDIFDYAKIDERLAVNGFDQEIMINLLNVLISKCAEESSVATVPGGANQFYLKSAHEPLGICKALCTHRGYSYSMKAGSGVVLLNVNSLTSAFWSPLLVSEVMDDPILSTMNWRDFEGLIKGVRVYLTYERGDKKEKETFDWLNSTEERVKPIFEIGSDPSDRNNYTPETFTSKDGKRIPVLDYFKKLYGPNFIKKPYLPLVNIGTKDKKRWVPAEKLQIVAYQKLKGLVPSVLTAAMLKTACQKPPVARALVGLEGLSTLGWKPTQTQEYPLKSCPALSLCPSLLKVDAGVLSPPSIRYRKDASIPSTGGRWRFDAKIIGNLYRTNPQTSFNALVLRGQGVHDQVGLRIFQNLVTWGQNTYHIGTMRLAANVQGSVLDHRSIDQAIKSQIGKGVNMALMAVYSKDVPLYSAFKDLCDRKFGLHALCVTKKAEGNKGDFWGNVALKVNLKAAGSNHTTQGLLTRGIMKDTLVLGADVTHPGPGSIPGCPSIAAVVGSVDDHAGRFLGSMRLQKKSRQEMIDEIQAMVAERLRDWIEAMTPKGNKYVTLPKAIIYYRDGVSESQYEQVKKEELSKFDNAFTDVLQHFEKQGKLNPATDKAFPAIVAIVCGKRHHVRFYPVDPRNRNTHINDNCLPGTTVDDVVTSPYYQDFYLQSHAAIKGTARPAHYFVVHNSAGMPVSDIRRFTHDLCYTYVRASVGVSYAAPAYYADRLCERGRCYLRDFYVAPKGTGIRASYDREKARIEGPVKAAREKDHPRFNNNNSNNNNNNNKGGDNKDKGKDKDVKKRDLRDKRKGKKVKDPKLVARQEADKRSVEGQCAEWVMGKAREEFERYHKGGNPWDPRIGHTMFWM